MTKPRSLRTAGVGALLVVALSALLLLLATPSNDSDTNRVGNDRAVVEDR